VTGSYGLGEYVVQGVVTPDEWVVFKPTLAAGKRPIVSRQRGSKEVKLVYSGGARATRSEATPETDRRRFCLEDNDVLDLARWGCVIEAHYSRLLGRAQPMDIEWAKDGLTGELFIVQARPETVQTQKKKDNISVKEYKILSKTPPICKGKAVGRSIVSGRVSIVQSLADAGKVQQGDIIVADITNPDWNSLLKKAVSIVTNKGGRTSHASIVARELGIHAVVGTMDATQKLKDGQIITVSCIEGDEGRVYDGQLTWEEKELHFESTVPTQTKPMFILADPDNAFRLSFYPNKGVGLLRMEFIIANAIRIHPMAPL
jgi:pyruvate,water dikinase